MRAWILGGIVAVALAAGGCATAGAKAQLDPPSLDVPAPPPRVVVAPEPPQVEPETPPPSPEPSQQKPPRRSTPARSEPRADPRTQKTEPQPPPPPVVEPVRPVPAPTATLQQTPPSQTSEMERQVREKLVKAGSDLDRVNYKALSADGRSQYDQAKRFIKQAEQALEEKNLVFAVNVAQKAADLATSLLGR